MKSCEVMEVVNDQDTHDDNDNEYEEMDVDQEDDNDNDNEYEFVDDNLIMNENIKFEEQVSENNVIDELPVKISENTPWLQLRLQLKETETILESFCAKYSDSDREVLIHKIQANNSCEIVDSIQKQELISSERNSNLDGNTSNAIDNLVKADDKIVKVNNDEEAKALSVENETETNQNDLEKYCSKFNIRSLYKLMLDNGIKNPSEITRDTLSKIKRHLKPLEIKRFHELELEIENSILPDVDGKLNSTAEEDRLIVEFPWEKLSLQDVESLLSEETNKLVMINDVLSCGESSLTYGKFSSRALRQVSVWKENCLHNVQALKRARNSALDKTSAFTKQCVRKADKTRVVKFVHGIELNEQNVNEEREKERKRIEEADRQRKMSIFDSDVWKCQLCGAKNSLTSNKCASCCSYRVVHYLLKVSKYANGMISYRCPATNHDYTCCKIYLSRFISEGYPSCGRCRYLPSFTKDGLCFECLNFVRQNHCNRYY